MCIWRFRERVGDPVEMADLQRAFEERAGEKRKERR